MRCLTMSIWPKHKVHISWNSATVSIISSRFSVYCLHMLMSSHQSVSNSISLVVSTLLCLSIWSSRASWLSLYSMDVMRRWLQQTYLLFNLFGVERAEGRWINILSGNGVRFNKKAATCIGIGTSGRALAIPDACRTILLASNSVLAPCRWVHHCWSCLIQVLLHSSWLQHTSQLWTEIYFCNCPVGVSFGLRLPVTLLHSRLVRSSSGVCAEIMENRPKKDGEDASFHCKYSLDKSVDERWSS